VAYVRTVKTSSGATAVQIVWSTRHGDPGSGDPLPVPSWSGRLSRS